MSPPPGRPKEDSSRYRHARVAACMKARFAERGDHIQVLLSGHAAA